MSNQLKGSTAVITGASSGLGRALALELADRRMKLVLAARRLDRLEELCRELEKKGSPALAHSTDVTRPEECRGLMERAAEHFSGIDYLILNAGLSMWVPLREVTELDVFRRLIEVNYLGVVHCAHAALPYLLESRGMIVAISSAQAVFGMPRHTGYAASKHAVRGFLEGLEMECGDRVRFLEVMPGWVRGTDLRSSALGGDAKSIGASRRPHGRDSVTAEECARRIVAGIESGARDLYIPSKLRLVPWLKLIFPRWTKAKIRRAVEKEHGQ